MMQMFFGFLCFLAVFVNYCASQSEVYGEWQSGRASRYNVGSSHGGCGFSGYDDANKWPHMLTFAPQTRFFNDAKTCGECYEIRCIHSWEYTTNGCCSTTNAVVAQVSNECPGSGVCSDPDITTFDLAYETFDEIADPNICGLIEMEYRRVSCDVPSNIIIENKDGSNSWWYAMRINYVAGYGSLSKVEIKEYGASDDDWINAVLASNYFWLVSGVGGIFDLPLSVRLTDTNGNVLTSTDIISSLDEYETFDFGKNFEVDIGTSIPTNAPSFSPSVSPTLPSLMPTDAPTNNRTIMLRNGENSSQWWYRVWITQIADGYTLSEVKIGRSDTDVSTWLSLNNNGWWVNGPNGMQLPWSIQLVADNGDNIIVYDIITTYEEDEWFDTQTNFGI